VRMMALSFYKNMNGIMACEKEKQLFHMC